MIEKEAVITGAAHGFHVVKDEGRVIVGRLRGHGESEEDEDGCCCWLLVFLVAALVGDYKRGGTSFVFYSKRVLGAK